MDPAATARAAPARSAYGPPVTINLAYRNRLRALLTPAERRVFARLDTPQKIQTFLDKLPANF